jgi:hypothetical protein
MCWRRVLPYSKFQYHSHAKRVAKVFLACQFFNVKGPNQIGTVKKQQLYSKCFTQAQKNEVKTMLVFTAFDNEIIAEEVSSRNRIFSMIIFPHIADINCFLMLKNISKEISTSIKKFQFTVVVRPSQFLQAKIFRFFLIVFLLLLLSMFFFLMMAFLFYFAVIVPPFLI